MIIRRKIAFAAFFAVYVVATLFTAYKIIWTTPSVLKPSLSSNVQPSGDLLNTEIPLHHVEIWGKAAIGLYLWQHIFEADLVSKLNGVWHYGQQQVNGILFRFRTGPGVVVEKAPRNVSHLVLVLNGRTTEKVDYAKSWLNELPRFPRLQSVMLVLLGNELCNNEWLTPYLVEHGGFVGAVFVVYDSTDVDDRTFFQWPLGVATYRDFPASSPSPASMHVVRPYRCSFLGTVYPNSSRQILLNILRHNVSKQLCFVKARMQWVAHETNSSSSDYIWSLQHSDLTLSPIGQNCECYRIYEAMAFGSVPVVEDVAVQGGRCDTRCLRLLKAYAAPVVYVSRWTELPALLAREVTMTRGQVVDRRRRLISWYHKFKGLMKAKFVDVVRKTFAFHQVDT